MKNDSTCICINARGLAHRLTQLYDQRMAASGLKVTQYSVIKKVIDQPDSRVSEIAQACGLDRTTLTRNLRVLERDGWIELTESADKREKRIRFARGRRSDFQRARAAWEQLQNELADLVDTSVLKNAEQQITEKLEESTK